jgi:hypothetical protein
MKSHGSIQLVRMWCGIPTNPILWCFDNLEVLNYGNLLVGVVSKLVNGLRLSTAVPNEDLSGAWVTIRG